jgi:hypothetical protein
VLECRGWCGKSGAKQRGDVEKCAGEIFSSPHPSAERGPRTNKRISRAMAKDLRQANVSSIDPARDRFGKPLAGKGNLYGNQILATEANKLATIFATIHCA